MIFRKTEKKDISEVLKIIESAKERMKNMGLDQWQNGYQMGNMLSFIELQCQIVEKIKGFQEKF